MRSGCSFLQLTSACAIWALIAVPAYAAGSANMTVSAVVLSKSNCKFQSATGPTLNFGTLNPSSTSNAVATATTTVTCNGSANPATFGMNAGNGSYYSGGSRRMRNSTVTTEFIPYSLSFSPSSATVTKGTPQMITIQATTTPADFQNAVAGTYSDIVAITVSP